MWHTYSMSHPPETPGEVERWLRQQLRSLVPAALGSVSLRRSPCPRPNCSSCRTGEQHASYVLYGRQEGRRFAVYLPVELAEPLREALGNGRRVQELLYEAGRRYAEALKRERRRRR